MELLLKRRHFIDGARRIGCSDEPSPEDIARVRAFADVEVGPYGPWQTLKGERVPTILFEAHKFYKFTGGKYTSARTYLGYPISTSGWRRGSYGPVSHQHERLRLAVSLDREAALKSASWGAWQVMGFNYERCGYDSVQDLVNAAYSGIGGHLELFVRFMLGDDRLVRVFCTGDMDTVFELYNGRGWRKNKYGEKFDRSFDEFLIEENREAVWDAHQRDIWGPLHVDTSPPDTWHPNELRPLN